MGYGARLAAASVNERCTALVMHDHSAQSDCVSRREQRAEDEGGGVEENIGDNCKE